MQLVVAGTAGGVGTTTVTALLFEGLRHRAGGAPLLHDHTGGTLGRRLTDGDEVAAIDDRMSLADLGPHAFGPGLAALQDPDVAAIVVSAATGAGCDLAAAGLDAIRDAYGHPGQQRAVLVLCGAVGPARVGSRLAALRSSGARGVVLVGADPALSTDGPIPWNRLSRRTRASVAELVGLIQATPPRRG